MTKSYLPCPAIVRCGFNFSENLVLHKRKKTTNKRNIQQHLKPLFFLPECLSQHLLLCMDVFYHTIYLLLHRRFNVKGLMIHENIVHESCPCYFFFSFVLKSIAANYSIDHIFVVNAFFSLSMHTLIHSCILIIQKELLYNDYFHCGVY